MTADRYSGSSASAAGRAQANPGWTLETLLRPSQLFGANGMRFDARGRLHVAQAFGSQISRIDPATGAVEVVSAPGSEVVAPDDLAFDSGGTLYATEVFSERVSAIGPDGRTRVIAGAIPVANGITIHRDRIFVDEFRMGGRVLELFADGRAPRVIAKDVMFPNALAFGPDEHLYFPLVVTGQIGRVPVGGGEVEIFASGLNVPTAVKFDAAGHLVTVQSGSGEVTRFDLQSRQATSLGRVRIGIDNLEFSAAGDLYLSNFADGGISRLLAGGAEQVLVGRGLVGPAGLACAADGTIYAADGMSYAVVSPGGEVVRPTNLLIHGFPGYVRGVAVGPDGALYFANSAGGIARFTPGREAEFLATDLDQLMGLAVAPDGSLIACEAGAGRLLAIRAGGEVRVLKDGLRRPTGVAVLADGSCYVSEAAGGLVVQVRNGEASTVLAGLAEPHGVAVAGALLFVLDRAARSMHAVDLACGRAQIVVRDLPVGPAPGIVPKVLPGIAGIMPGPLLPFADLAAAPDGALLIGAEGDGSLLRLRAGSSRRFE